MAHSGDSATQQHDPEDAGRSLARLHGLRVLRLCSVFEPADLTPGAARYDAIGGMQNHAAELTRCLDQLGVRQLVVTSRQDGPAGRLPFGCRSEVVRTGVRMPWLRQAWAPFAAGTAMSDRGPVSVVHAHCGEDIAVLPMARMAALRHRCPLVVTVHTSVRHTMRVTSARTAVVRAAGGLAEGRVLPRADAVIALTRSAGERLCGGGVRASRIRIIPPGYDPALFAAAAPDPVPGLGRPRVAYIGRLSAQKDVATLVEAFRQLPGDATLLVVGDGPDLQAVARRARPLGERAHFTGFVAHARIPAFLRHIDVLVLATHYEELPSILIEAMAAAVPVIASAVGGIPELISHDVNGLLVPPSDPGALARAIRRVIADRPTADRLAQSGRRTAEAYAWPSLARRVALLYQDLTGGSANTPPS